MQRIKIHKLVTQERIDERVGVIYKFMKFGLLPVLTVWSLVTVGFFIIPYFMRFELHWAIVLLLSSLIIGVQESIKLLGGRKATQIIFYGWVSTDRMVYGIILFLILVVTSPAYFSSAMMSINGAEKSIDNLTIIQETFTPPNNIKDIKREYKTRIDEINKQIEKLDANPLTIASSTNKTKRRFLDQIEELENEKKEELRIARAENYNAEGKFGTSKNYFAGWLKALGGVPEGLVIAILCLMAFIEKKVAEEEQLNPSPTPERIKAAEERKRKEEQEAELKAQCEKAEAEKQLLIIQREREELENAKRERELNAKREREERERQTLNANAKNANPSSKTGTLNGSRVSRSRSIDVKPNANGNAKNANEKRECEQCGEDISNKRKGTKYCSGQCRGIAFNNAKAAASLN